MLPRLTFGTFRFFGRSAAFLFIFHGRVGLLPSLAVVGGADSGVMGPPDQSQGPDDAAVPAAAASPFVFSAVPVLPDALQLGRAVLYLQSQRAHLWREVLVDVETALGGDAELAPFGRRQRRLRLGVRGARPPLPLAASSAAAVLGRR